MDDASVRNTKKTKGLPSVQLSLLESTEEEKGELDDRKWFIYVLASRGVDFYVGRTHDAMRRQTQHRARFGRHIDLRIVETGFGRDGAKAAEIRWIESLAGDGVILENQMLGSSGNWQLSKQTLATLREHGNRLWSNPEYRLRQHAGLTRALADPEHRERRRKSAKEVSQRPEVRAKVLPGLIAAAKRPWTPERKAALSAKTKGKQKHWTDEGRQRVQSSQFKPGHYKFSELPQEVREYHIAARRKQWDGVDPETRTKMAHDRNIEAWAKRDPEERKAIGRNISAGKYRNKSAEEIAAIARTNGAKAFDKPGVRERVSAATKAWWAALTPEAKAEYVAKRGEAIRAAKLRKALSASA